MTRRQDVMENRLADLAQRARQETLPPMAVDAGAVLARMRPAPPPLRLMASWAVGSGLAAAVALALTLAAAPTSLSSHAGSDEPANAATTSASDETLSPLFSPLQALELP
jgi:hypothetical protein